MKTEKRSVDKNLHDLITCTVAPRNELSHVMGLSKVQPPFSLPLLISKLHRLLPSDRI